MFCEEPEPWTDLAEEKTLASQITFITCKWLRESKTVQVTWEGNQKFPEVAKAKIREAFAPDAKFVVYGCEVARLRDEKGKDQGPSSVYPIALATSLEVGVICFSEALHFLPRVDDMDNPRKIHRYGLAIEGPVGSEKKVQDSEVTTDYHKLVDLARAKNPAWVVEVTRDGKVVK